MIDKAKRQALKKEVSKQNFRYNRFLLLRYSLAVLFFTNLYWSLALYLSHKISLFLPLSLLIFSLVAIGEHVRLYGENASRPPRLKWNYYYHLLQLGSNFLLVLIVALSNRLTTIFPFLTNTRDAKIFIVTLLVGGILLSLSCLKRVSAINTNQDKHYQYIKEFESAYK